jgi:hypothetical protein
MYNTSDAGGDSGACILVQNKGPIRQRSHLGDAAPDM